MASPTHQPYKIFFSKNRRDWLRICWIVSPKFAILRGMSVAISSKMDSPRARGAESATTSTDGLFELAYDELRDIARGMMFHEKIGNTLSATALVNEAYLRLGKARWDSRGHFFTSAAEAMRRILIDRARCKCTKKRSGTQQFVELDSLTNLSDIDLELLLDIDHLLIVLAGEDAQAAEMVKLRIFTGLNVIDAGKCLNLRKNAAYQLWDFCLSWFAVRLASNDFSGSC